MKFQDFYTSQSLKTSNYLILRFSQIFPYYLVLGGNMKCHILFLLQNFSEVDEYGRPVGGSEIAGGPSEEVLTEYS